MNIVLEFLVVVDRDVWCVYAYYYNIIVVIVIMITYVIDNNGYIIYICYHMFDFSYVVL